MADTSNVPLVVDLDGTLIRTDLMWESLACLLRRNPVALFLVLYWWSRGRARLKQELGRRVQVEAARLPYHQPFLDWLRKEKTTGRKIILATASDRLMVEPVARHLGFFDGVLASDGQVNLRRNQKRLALVQRFGERGFDYAGNSPDDLTVWQSARTAICGQCVPLGFARGGRLRGAWPFVLCRLFLHRHRPPFFARTVLAQWLPGRHGGRPVAGVFLSLFQHCRLRLGGARDDVGRRGRQNTRGPFPGGLRGGPDLLARFPLLAALDARPAVLRIARLAGSLRLRCLVFRSVACVGRQFSRPAPGCPRCE